MDAELKRLLQAAKGIEMSPEEREEQRINFAYGNAGEGEEGTKEAVRAAATVMKGAKNK